MIPTFYKCSSCKVTGVKLWRGYNDSHVELLCADCVVKVRKDYEPVNLAVSDQAGWNVPAVPTLDEPTSYWGYTSVPAEGCAWWDALPLRLTGQWPVNGGIHRWMPYREGTDLFLDKRAKIKRCEMTGENPRMLVFISAAEESRTAYDAVKASATALLGEPKRSELNASSWTLAGGPSIALRLGERGVNVSMCVMADDETEIDGTAATILVTEPRDEKANKYLRATSPVEAFGDRVGVLGTPALVTECITRLLGV